MRDNARSITELYQALRPLILRDVATATSSASSTGTHQHELDRSAHIGTLSESQAPWASTKSDIQALLEQQMLHNRVHTLADTTGLGSDHVVSGLTARQVLRATGVATAAFGAIEDADLPSTIVRTSRMLTAGDGLSGLGDLSANRTVNIELSATSGLELAGSSPDKTLQIADTVAGNGLSIASKVLAVGVATTIQSAAGAGLSVEADAIRLTAGYNPGSNTSILASDATGKLTLPLMVATTSLTTPLILAGAGQSLTLQPPVDLILDPASNRTKMAAGVSIESSAYASQTTGWRVTDAGEADFRYLYVDEMHAKSFIADLEQALAGGQIIAKSVAVLYSNFTAPAAGATAQLVVRDLPSATGMAVFVNGDYIRIRTFSRAGGSLTIGDCWGTVVLDTTYGTSGFDGTTKTQRYTFTRSSGADAGAMVAGTVVYADAIILDYGTAGNGIYEVNAIDGAYGLNSPYAQVATWATHPRTMSVKSRLGNLRGIFSIDNEYGLYAGSGTAVTDRYIRASNTALELRNVPLALYDGTNNTMLLSAGASNNSPFMALGSTLPTGPLVNDGIWLGKDGAAYKWRVGTVSGGALVKGIYWDGADLVWKATNTSLDASGNLVAGPVTLSAAGVTSTATNDYASNAAYKFSSSGVVTSGTFAYATPSDTSIWMSTNLWGGSSLVQDANRNAYTRVGAYAISTKDAAATFEAEARDAYGATVKLARILASANGAQSSLDFNADTVKANTYTVWHAGNDGHNSTLDADTLDTYHASSFALLSGPTFTGHVKVGTTNTYDIGEAGVKWRTIYVGNIVADTISGTSLSGATWRNDASDMGIYSSAAGTRTLAIANDGAGVMNVTVDGSVTAGSFSTAGNITLSTDGATVDGVDLSGFKTVYDAHVLLTTAHGATGAVVGTTNTQTLTNKTLTSPILTTPQINDTSADHQYIFAVSELAADRTVTLPLLTANDTFVFAAFAQTLTNKTLTTPTIGDFTNAGHAHTNAASGGQISHGSLTNVTADQHHAQQHSITGSDHTITASTLQVVGATATNTLGLLTPSSNPGAAARILATTSAGALTVVDLSVTALSASRLVASDGSDKIVSVSALSSWIAGTSNRVTVADDGDGTITLSAPQDIHTAATPTFGGLIAPWLRPATDSTTALQLCNASGTAIVTVDTTSGRFGIGNTPTYKLDVSGDIRTTGTLYADGGIVDFGTNYLQEGSTYFELKGSKPFALNQNLQISGYASQTTGWRITSAGEADFRYLFVDEIHAKSLIADLEQALAGGQIIAKSVAVLYVNFTAPAAGATADLYVRDLPSAPEMQVFETGDTIRIRTFSRSAGSLTIADCWGTVSAPYNVVGDGYQYWLFTRSAAPNAGTMAAGTVVYKDAIVLDYGTAGNGIYEVNAIDGAYGLNSPYAQIANWTSHPASMTVRTRFGNLRGITAQDNEYGLFAGAGTAVTDRYIRASSYTMELRNVPLALYDGTNNTVLLSAGASNNSPFLAMGATLPTGPLTHNGLWMGKDGTDYELRVGNVSGGALTDGLHWNGSALLIGNSVNENLYLSSSVGVQFRYGASVLGSLDGTSWTLGQTGTGENNVYITPSSLSLRSGTTALATLAGSALTLGTANEQIYLSSVVGIEFRYGTTVQGSMNGTTWTLGKTDTTDNHVTITPTAVSLKYGTTTLASLAADTLTLGGSNEKVKINSTVGVQFLNGTDVLGSLDGTTWTLGQTGTNQDWVKITPGAIQFFNGVDERAAMTGSIWTIGNTTGSNNNLYLDSATISFRQGSTTIGSMSGTDWTLGKTGTGESNVQITPSTLSLRSGTTALATLAGSALTLGTTNENVYISSVVGVQFRYGTTVHGSLNGSTWTLGQTGTGQSNIQITASALQFRHGSNVQGSLTADTWVIGGVNEHVRVSSSYGVEFRNGSTTVGQLNGTTLTLGQTTGNHVAITSTTFDIKYGSTSKISLDSSGNASISGLLAVGASGEIRQGTGTWGSSFTGLRIWSDASVGRIAGYSNSAIQWSANSNGALYAGGDKVRLSATGVSLEIPAIAGAFSETQMTTNAAALRWFPDIAATWTTAADLSAIYSYRETTYNSNDVAIVSRVGSTAYATRTARVLVQPMLWTGSVFKQANLIASINNTDSQLSWDGTKFAISAGHMVMTEISAPANPSANQVILFARDNGSGKTQLTAKFSNGTVVNLATEA